MRSPTRPLLRAAWRRGFVPVVAVLLLVLLAAPRANAAGYPPLPIGLDRGFLKNLSAPDLAPGGTGTVAYTVGDPLTGSIAEVELTLDLYAFNAFPGNATSTVPVSGAPVLTTPGSSGSWANLSIGILGPGQSAGGSVEVATSASTPAGAFAVRTALSFVLTSNGTAYRLESRGWFTATTWNDATSGPNGSATLNLSVLGVSGVTPETAVYVSSSSWDWALGAILAAALVLVGAAAFVYFRRGPGSRSGTR